MGLQRMETCSAPGHWGGAKGTGGDTVDPCILLQNTSENKNKVRSWQDCHVHESFYLADMPILSVRYPITVLSASCKEKGWCGFRIILRAEKLLDDFQIANIFTMKSWKKWWGWINTHTHKEVIFCIFRKRSKFACGCYWGFFVPGNKFGIFVLIGKSVRCQGFWREPIKKTCSGNLSKRLKTQSLPLRY